MDKEFPTIAEQERYWANKEATDALVISQSASIARLIGERDEARAEVLRLRGILADINARANKLCESVETVQRMLRGE